jgi:hypothetical protein
MAVRLRANAQDMIFAVHISFRFDKSKENFSIQKFRRQPTVPFDLVVATIIIFGGPTRSRFQPLNRWLSFAPAHSEKDLVSTDLSRP